MDFFLLILVFIYFCDFFVVLFIFFLDIFVFEFLSAFHSHTSDEEQTKQPNEQTEQLWAEATLTATATAAALPCPLRSKPKQTKSNTHAE